jgi:nitrite reductase/ring-hydroxylating ferredoxin subunit
MSVAGFLGGTLVYRNQIGVDHRYADAGKWQEEERTESSAPALTSAAAGLGLNQMKLVHAADRRIAVARTENGYAAFQDRCTHKGGPLSDGVLICGTVQCPWHGSQFDVHSGAVKCGPAEQPIETYEIEGPRTVRRTV